MKRLKSAFFLLLCFALGIGVALAFEHLRTAPKPGGTTSPIGIGDAPPLRGLSLPATASPATVDGFAALHATAVAIEYSGDAAGLGRFAYHAHKVGLKVLLLPPPTASAENPFPKPLATIAAEAEAAEVDVLCVSWLNADPDEDYWQKQIAGVRSSFNGRLILAAAPEFLPGIEFWDKVDLIGAIGPYDLPLRAGAHARNIGLQDLRTAWACYVDSLESLAFRYGKRLVLLNVTVPQPESLVVDDFPALTDEALVTETKGRSGTEGLFLQWQPTGAGSVAEQPFVNHSAELVSRISTLWTPSKVPATKPPPATEDDDPDEADTNP